MIAVNIFRFNAPLLLIFLLFSIILVHQASYFLKSIVLKKVFHKCGGHVRPSVVLFDLFTLEQLCRTDTFLLQSKKGAKCALYHDRSLHSSIEVRLEKPIPIFNLALQLLCLLSNHPTLDSLLLLDFSRLFLGRELLDKHALVFLTLFVSFPVRLDN